MEHGGSESLSNTCQLAPHFRALTLVLAVAMLSGFAFAPVAHAEVDRDFTEGDNELWEQECAQDLEADRPTAEVTGVSDSSARAATDAVIA